MMTNGVMKLMVDMNMTEAMDVWIEHALPPGSCTELLLRGLYDEAILHAHPNIKPHFKDHIEYVERYVPEYCRGENYDNWKGIEDYELRLKCQVDLGEDNEVFEV